MNTSSWKEFRLGDWFEVRKGRRLTSLDQEPGDTPYIGAVDSDNGVTNHIAQPAIHQGNTISLSYNGSVGEAFYQPEPYWATDDVNVLYLRECANWEMSEAIGLFVATILRQEKYRFSYGRKWTLSNMENAIIKLPCTTGGLPDWAWMEEFIVGLDTPGLTTAVTSPSMALSADDWREFMLTELYTIRMGDKFDMNKMSDYDPQVNFVSRISSDNGVAGKVDYVDGVAPHPAGLLTVALGGSLGSAFVQHESFYTAQNVAILEPRFVQMDFFVNLFVSALIRYEAKTKYCAFGRELNVHINKDFTVCMPIDGDGSPDWQWIKDYMRSLPHSDRISA